MKYLALVLFLIASTSFACSYCRKASNSQASVPPAATSTVSAGLVIRAPQSVPSAVSGPIILGEDSRQQQQEDAISVVPGSEIYGSSSSESSD